MLSKRRPRTASICIRDILQDFAGRRVIGTISATFIYRTAAEMCSGASTALTISASAPTSGPSVRVMQDMMNALFFLEFYAGLALRYYCHSSIYSTHDPSPAIKIVRGYLSIASLSTNDLSFEARFCMDQKICRCCGTLMLSIIILQI